MLPSPQIGGKDTLARMTLPVLLQKSTHPTLQTLIRERAGSVCVPPSHPPTRLHWVSSNLKLPL